MSRVPTIEPIEPQYNHCTIRCKTRGCLSAPFSPQIALCLGCWGRQQRGEPSRPSQTVEGARDCKAGLRNRQVYKPRDKRRRQKVTHHKRRGASA